MRQLGDLEAAVMDRLWAWERPTTVREVFEDIARTRPLAYTTIMTVMDNLHRKGVLAREAHGRAYRYVAARSRAEHSADLIAAVLSHAEDRTVPLLRFVERMTPDEVARLRSALKAEAEPAHPSVRRSRRGGPTGR